MKLKHTQIFSGMIKTLLVSVLMLLGATLFADMRPIAQGLYINGSTKFSNGRHIAYDSKGRLHAVFTQKLSSNAGNPGVYAWSDDNGTTWTVGLSDLDQGTATDPAWGNFTPAISIGSDDSIHIAWYQAYKTANNKAVFYSVSHDRGVSFAAPVPVTAAMTDSTYVWPSMTLDNKNRPYIAFSDPYGTKGIFVTMQDSSSRWLPGKKISDQTTPKDTAGIEYNPSLGTNGCLFIFWDSASSNGKVYLNRSENFGETWEGVSVPLSTGSGRVLWPSMTFDSHGNTYMSVTLNSGSVFKIWVIKRATDGTWSKPSIDNLFPPDKVKGYMRSSLTCDESDQLNLFVEGTPESRKNWNIWQTAASVNDLEHWEAPRRISDSKTGDNAYVSVPTIVKGINYIPVIWSHGDLSDSDTGHLSGELPQNGIGIVMFSAF